MIVKHLNTGTTQRNKTCPHVSKLGTSEALFASGLRADGPSTARGPGHPPCAPTSSLEGLQADIPALFLCSHSEWSTPQTDASSSGFMAKVICLLVYPLWPSLIIILDLQRNCKNTEMQPFATSLSCTVTSDRPLSIFLAFYK